MVSRASIPVLIEDRHHSLEYLENYIGGEIMWKKDINHMIIEHDLSESTVKASKHERALPGNNTFWLLQAYI